MVNYGVDYLNRLVGAVSDFEEAFQAWIQTQIESDHMSARGLFPTVWVRESQDETKVRALELSVAEAAGRAAAAVSVTGARIHVQGVGLIDPISNWSMMRNPRAILSPQDVRMTAATVRGRLTALITDAETSQTAEFQAFSPALMHPIIWSGAAAHWTTHQYRVASREAAEALTVHWKERLERFDADDTSFWQPTLSPGIPEPGKPKLRWPGQKSDKTTRSMRGGLEPLAKSLNNLATGLNLTVRNITTHSRNELDEQEAIERLGAYSYLAHLLDICEIERAV
ncbi:TIGR02391 family protein [Dietzia psychralcaliphila]|uniref:TIGR02391 family protein n=1 Tax=Dietzia psychralcaliphila TaxID=139021 RepID=UPI001C1E0AC1|nr:TIGR02391 family protein [Dietzia psychralcaliphila]